MVKAVPKSHLDPADFSGNVSCVYDHALSLTGLPGDCMFFVKVDLDRSTTHSKFDPTRVQTHDL